MNISGVWIFADVGDRRALGEVGRIFERRLAEPGRREQREVGGVPEVRPVGDVALADRRLEAGRLRHDPVGQQAAAAAAGDAHPRLVDVALLQDLVDAGHQVLVVVARVVVLDDVAEVLAVVRAAARVRVEHDVALGGHPLELVREGVAVGGVRAAVDLEDQRVLLRRRRTPAASRIQPWIFVPSKLVYQISSGSVIVSWPKSASLNVVSFFARRRGRGVEHVQIADDRRPRTARARTSAAAASAV